MEGEYYADLQSGEEQGLHDHEQCPSEGRAAEPESKGTAVVYAVAAGRLAVFDVGTHCKLPGRNRQHTRGIMNLI